MALGHGAMLPPTQTGIFSYWWINPYLKPAIELVKDRLYDLELETDTVLSSVIRAKNEWYSPKYTVLPFKQMVEQEGIRL